MFLRLDRNSTFRRNLMLNLLQALLVAVLVLTLFLSMYSRFRGQEMHQRKHLLNTELEHIGDELENFGSLFGQSKYMDSLNRIAILRAPLAAHDYYSLMTAQNYLSAIVSMNNSLADAILVFPRSDVLLTRDSIYISESHFTAQCRGTIDPALFMREASENGLIRAIYPGGSIRIGGGAGHDVAFIYRVPLGTPSIFETKCYAYMLLSYDKVMDSLLTENMKRYGSLEIISAETDEVLCTYSATPEFSREGALVSVSNSNHTLRINAYLPETYFQKSLRSVSLLTWFGILSVFVISIFGAYFTAWRQSLPMRRLLSDLEREGFTVSHGKNEYAWLKKNIRRMNIERADIAQQLDQHRQTVRTGALEALFSGIPLPPERMVQAGLDELPRPFMVGIARFRSDSSLSSGSAQDVRLMIMLQTLKTLLPESSVLCTFDNRTVSLLVPCPADQSATIAAIENSLMRCDEFSAHPIQITFSAPISDLGEIAASFDSLLASGADLPDDRAVHVACEYTEGRDFTFRNLQQFHALIAGGNLEGAKQALHAYLSCPYRQCGTMHQRFYTARAIAMLAVSTLGISDAPLHKQHFDVSDDSRMLSEKFDIALEECLSQLNTQRAQSQDARIQQMLDYIAAHYSDPNCCPATIAEQFNLSEKHLYTLLRENTNQTPAALLLDMRLNCAAKLLRESDQSIQTISEAAGFANFSTFYKAFKRAYALTPSQYRTSESAGKSPESE